MGCKESVQKLLPVLTEEICEAYVENNYTNTERSYWLPNCLRVFKELCNYERLPTVPNT